MGPVEAGKVESQADEEREKWIGNGDCTLLKGFTRGTPDKSPATPLSPPVPVPDSWAFESQGFVLEKVRISMSACQSLAQRSLG